MENWKSMLLKDFCIFNANTYGNKDVWIYVNYLDTGNITNNKIEKVQYIDLNKEKLPSRARRKISYNSIIYSTVRPNQLHYGIIKNIPDNFLVSTGFIVIDVDEKIADADFIYYWLSQSSMADKLQAIAEQSTSTYPSIKLSDLAELEIYLPPLWIQKNISGILSIIDKKITNNDKINRNLSEQLKAIFLKMFPTITDNGSNTLEEIISFSNGKKRPDTEGKVPVYGGNGILSYTDKSNAENCVIIGRVGAYCGSLYLSVEPCWISDNAIKAKAKNSNSQMFIYYLLQELALSNRHIGTSQPLLTQGILNAIHFNCPSEEDVISFCKKADDIQKLIDMNTIENKRLSELRDTLLPKLMSGELDVSDLYI